jgi:hypothetical protein
MKESMMTPNTTKQLNFQQGYPREFEKPRTVQSTMVNNLAPLIRPERQGMLY